MSQQHTPPSGAPSVFSIADPLPTGTTLLEASAGTGKTWTIGALVTRYVAEGVTRLDEMLIVTFGRAASQELRERVRDQLVRAERALADPGTADAGDALLAVLLDAEPVELARRHARLRDALGEFDAATIATTHQFCQLVLRGLGVAGDTDSSAMLIDDLDDLLVEVVDDAYLRGFARSSGQPVFDRETALQIARAVVADPQATIEPRAAAAGTGPGRRVRFAALVRAELEHRKRRLGILSYDDLLSQLADALGDPDAPARERMRRRWRVVLVDEFQDTDPVQWQVLARAFTQAEQPAATDADTTDSDVSDVDVSDSDATDSDATDAETTDVKTTDVETADSVAGGRTLVLIGDPKQAIYAFRGGDVVTYLAAQQSASTRRTLASNWRSDAPLVRAWQSVLRGAALGDPQIVVHDVQAHHQHSRLAGLPAAADAPWRMRVLTRAQLDTTPDRAAVVSVARPAIARDLALDVQRLLTSGATFDGRPLQAGDVAVLAPTGAQLALVQRALRDVGVPAVLAATGSVLTSPAARGWLAVLEAMEQPHRSNRVRAAALTELVGLTAEQLDADPEGSTDRVAALLRRWADLFALRGVAAVLESSMSGGLSERVLGLEGGGRLLTDLRHVAEVLHEVALRERHGLIALLTWLRQQVGDQGTASATTTRSRRLDSDAHAVQLSTIHRSKGLQWPVVYLPFLGDRWVGKDELPRFHSFEASDDADAAEGLVPQRSIDVGGAPSQAHRRQARLEDDGESLRLLYVALTRAQSQVVTWWAPMTTAESSALHRVLLGRAPGSAVAAPVPDHVPVGSDAAVRERLQAWQVAGGPVWEDADDPARPGAEIDSPAVELSIRAFTRDIDTEWRRTSYTALSAAGEQATGPTVSSESEVSTKDDEPPVSETVGAASADTAEQGAEVRSPMAELPVGATFGSLVHAVLEEADPQAADLRGELAAQIREQLIRWPVPHLDQGALADALVQVATSPLGPLAGGARLVDIGRRDRLCEMDFELPLVGGDRPDRAARGAVSSEPETTLGQIAPLLRRHLTEGDPLLAYADALAAPELGGQTLRGYLTGSVDVVLRVGERYLVVDYKTNWLGPPDEPLTAASYAPGRLAAAMGHSSYPLQALLYAVVLHRFLRWRLPGYAPDRHLGGVLYLYLRGMCGPQTPTYGEHPAGVFSWRPPDALVIALSDLLDGRQGDAA